MPISSPEDVCNESLRALGSKMSIGDIFEGSPQSRACLEIYGQTRDECLRSGEWSFAYGDALLTLLKGPAPNGGYYPSLPWSSIYPLPGWVYEYAYPADCVEVRDVIKQPARMPVLDPKPVLWRVNNDPVPVLSGPYPAFNPTTFSWSAPFPTASGPPQKVILCNAANPLAIYTRRVTNPLLWEADFVQTLIDAIAAKLSSSPVFAASADLMKSMPARAAQVGAVAQQHQG
jgi:hypothetical protein